MFFKTTLTKTIYFVQIQIVLDHQLQDLMLSIFTIKLSMRSSLKDMNNQCKAHWIIIKLAKLLELVLTLKSDLS